MREREAELNRKEKELATREQTLQLSGGSSKGRPPNWPRCRPLIHHDIAGDMPTPETVRLVKMAYGGWIASVCCLIWNSICMLAALIVDGGSTVGDYILSVIFIIILPIIWFLIYRLLYRAARKTRPSVYIVFWIFYFLELLSCGFFLAGAPSTGAAGLIYMFDLFEASELAVGFMVLASSVLWGLDVVFCLWIYIASRLEYRKAGGFARAKQDLKEDALGEAKNHPDLIADGAKFAAQEAIKHPDLVV